MNGLILKLTILGLLALTTSLVLAMEEWENSTLACTQGSNQTSHHLDCGHNIIVINRVMYGARNISSECNRTAPFENCCARDPMENDCLFESDYELSVFLQLCSGLHSCSLHGRRMYTSDGGCSPDDYPDLTSFSYVEYRCVNLTELIDFEESARTEATDMVYLDSKGSERGVDLMESRSQCVAFTDCDVTLMITAMDVRLAEFNETLCSEELIFQDLGNASMETIVDCFTSYSPAHQELFISQSNVMRFILNTRSSQRGTVILRVQASNETASVNISCGREAARALENAEFCPGFVLAYVEEEDNTTSVVTTPSTVSDRKSNKDNYLHPGAIVGITLAAIILVFLSVFLLSFFLKRWMAKLLSLADLEDEKLSVVSTESTTKDA